jgi:putative transposase
VKRIRTEYDGAFYHINQRGNNRKAIFLDPEEKAFYLDLVSKYKKQYAFKLLGYVLMDNHYHLLIQAGPEPLNKIMHRINSLYSRFYNKKNDHSGHVFSDRYAAGLIQDERYLFSVLRYIHWNPVRAGLSPDAESYKWSSDRAYRNNKDPLVDVDYILSIFSPDDAIAHKTYKQMMRVSPEEEEKYEEVSLIGDESFMRSIKDSFQSKKEQNELQTSRKSLAHLLSATGASDADIGLIKGGSRKRHLKPYKISYFLAAASEGYTLKEIGGFVNISDSAVNKLISL